MAFVLGLGTSCTLMVALRGTGERAPHLTQLNIACSQPAVQAAVQPAVPSCGSDGAGLHPSLRGMHAQ